MANPVLSGTCPVKPLYGVAHQAAAQFQGLGNLLIVLRKFFAMKCHVELPVTSIRE
ncbi:Hypothetical predicted protein, partial [Pelobates cultripes]